MKRKKLKMRTKESQGNTKKQMQGKYYNEKQREYLKTDIPEGEKRNKIYE